MNKPVKILYLLIVLQSVFFSDTSFAQEKVIRLDLQKTVQIASDSSLATFRAKNGYMASYWEYQSFKADRLPSLSLNMTPIAYNRDYVRRYDSGLNIDVYRRQQALYSFGNLAVKQNLDVTGGTFFIDSELGYLRNFGAFAANQYTSVPIRIGYRQDLFGYNPYKWEKKLAPQKFERAKKALLQDIQQIAETAAEYFFTLAMANAEYSLAKEILNNSDTLFKIGSERFKIAAIGKSDLLTLKLDLVNARNNLQTAEINHKRSMFALATYLNLEKNTKIEVVLPDMPTLKIIDVNQAVQLAKRNNVTYLQSEQQVVEAEQNVNKAKIESNFNLGISASLGFNQVSETFNKAYRNPQQQSIISLNLSVPIVDWGVRKGRYNMARNNLNISKINARESEIRLEEDVTMTINDLNIQRTLIETSSEAMELSKTVYEQTRERFIIGKVDLNNLVLAGNRRQETQRNYILSIKNYWQSYFRIRKFTLFDYDSNRELMEAFEWKKAVKN
ncbi:TolC family protein [Pedobacter sp. KBS0701]|nr:TolC family protein [Pedobacter sp. KBS0701]